MTNAKFRPTSAPARVAQQCVKRAIRRCCTVLTALSRPRRSAKEAAMATRDVLVKTIVQVRKKMELSLTKISFFGNIQEEV